MRKKIKRLLKKIEFKVRSLFPDFLKNIIRALKSFKKIELSEDVPQFLLDDCRFINSRENLISKMKENAIAVEIGTYRGDFARKIVAKTNPKKLHLIDVNYSYFNHKNLNTANIIIHEGLSTEIMQQFNNEYFDWIYIDADHSFIGVMNDALISHNKLKKGGYIIFNDFGHVSPSGAKFGVHRAAVKFSIKYQYKWKYFSYHKSALYDLAIQKPY